MNLGGKIWISKQEILFNKMGFKDTADQENVFLWVSNFYEFKLRYNYLTLILMER